MYCMPYHFHQSFGLRDECSNYLAINRRSQPDYSIQFYFFRFSKYHEIKDYWKIYEVHNKGSGSIDLAYWHNSFSVLQCHYSTHNLNIVHIYCTGTWFLFICLHGHYQIHNPIKKRVYNSYAYVYV